MINQKVNNTSDWHIQIYINILLMKFDNLNINKLKKYLLNPLAILLDRG